MNDYEMTIGIECHVQLATKTKLFSSADNDARDQKPNSVVTPIDFGLPGMLPVLNEHAITLAVKAGTALNAKVARVSRFDRKHYFYPDLPKGYQTTQMYEPIILEGYVDTILEDGTEKRVRIHHAHLEEDAGKLTHKSDRSLVDLNRAGTPLIEIVSQPDMHSAQEAKAYATELYRLMTFAGVTHGDLYHGNMRFDVNISIAKKGSTELGTRAEVKNLNSFRSVEKAAEFEFERQRRILEAGEKVVQETRGWDEAKQVTNSQRSKEDAQDYRYMPDADIPPIELTEQTIADIEASMPVMPGEYRKQWKSLAVDSSVLNALLSDKQYAQAVSAVHSYGDAHATRVANWFASVLIGNDKEVNAVDKDLNIDGLVELSKMVEANELSSTSAKSILLEIVYDSSKTPTQIAEEKGLVQVSDTSAIEAIVDEVLAEDASQKAISDIKAGNDKAIGYLVGQVMKRSKGQANPGMASNIIREKL